MRIISGKNKGRKITAPTNLPVRPTTDLGKESLFNILNNYFFFDRVTVLTFLPERETLHTNLPPAVLFPLWLWTTIKLAWILSKKLRHN